MSWVLALILSATFTRTMERVSTLDPVMAQSAYDMRAIKLVHVGVLEIDYAARPYRLIAGACEIPTVSEDGLVYSFTMHNPDLVAADVERELSRVADPKVASPNGYIMKKVKSIKVIDSRHLEIQLKERMHVFPWMLANIGIAKADGSGAGPYKLVSWRRNHEMVFKRKEAYATEHCFDVVKYLVVGDVSTQWLMFLKGETDLLGEISRDNWNSVVTSDGTLNPQLSAAGMRLVEASTLDSMYIGINMSDTVLGNNRKLRQALNCAFDFQKWSAFYNGRIDQSTGPIPLGVSGRLESKFAYSFDLEKAKQLMKEAGYPEGIDPNTGRKLVLTLSIGRATQESREAGELLASFYNSIGIKLELDFKTWDAYLRALNERRCQLYLIGWVGDYPDAENFLQLFHSMNISPGANHSNYVNKEFDDEYNKAMQCGDETERNLHWARCQEIVREDCPWIFTHYPKSYSLVHDRVDNYVSGAFPYGNEQFYKVKEK